MEEELNFIEIMVLVRELKKKVIDAKVRKIYHLNKNELTIRLYKQEKMRLKVKVPNYIALTDYKKEKPKEPSHFCMFLRKYLTNARIIGIKQPDMERIVEFELEKGKEKYYLIFELFSKGNVILCDKNKEILMPLKAQSWRSREIKPHKTYKLPPKRYDLQDIDFSLFRKIILEKDELVIGLATSLGIGGVYAEELCKISNLNKKEDPQNISENEFKILFDNFLKLIEKARIGEIKPNITLKEKEPVDVQPFDLELYSDLKKKTFESYNKAVDNFFSEYQSEEIMDKKESALKEEIEKLNTTLKKHENYLKELKEKSKIYKKEADYVYQNLGKIKDIFRNIKKAKEENKEWNEIQKIIQKGKEKGYKEAKMVKKIIPEEGVIVFDFNSGVRLSIRKSVTDNANDFYEKSKKMKSKLNGVQNQINKTKRKIDKVKKAGAESIKIEKKVPEKVKKREKEWFEKFHWFYTSQNRLVIAGRDANQNENLIEKYLKPNDIVLHADVHGSPFAIIKDGVDSTEEEKREAAVFTLCHSKAWQNKRIESVYWVKPEQVSKEAPSGEYVARGGFMIYGKKNYIKDLELKLGVGVQFEPRAVVSGPIENLRKRAKYYAVLLPGDKSKNQIAKEIKQFLMGVASSDYEEKIKKINTGEIREHAIEKSRIFGAQQ